MWYRRKREHYLSSMPACKLYLPFYRYGAEQGKVWDLSGNNNHGTIYGAGPELHSILSGAELVTNGGMEEGNPPTGWSAIYNPETFERSDVWKSQGSYSAHVVDSTPSYGGFMLRIPFHYGSGNDEFYSPYGITTDGTYLYVADTYNNRIVKRRADDLSYVSQIGSYGSGNDQFIYPYGIATDGTYLYIADNVNCRIVKRRVDNLSYVSQIGSYGGGNDQFYYPRGIATDGTYIYVADTYNNRVVKRRADDLSYVSQIGSQGSGNDEFYSPYGIITDGTYLYIADTDNHRIVKRRADDLSYVSQVGSYGGGNDQFMYPRGITADGTYLYIADTYNNRVVKRIANDLSYVSKVGSYGSGNDQFSGPCGITTDGTYLYVADTDNHRIVKRIANDLSYISKLEKRRRYWKLSFDYNVVSGAMVMQTEAMSKIYTGTGRDEIIFLSTIENNIYFKNCSDTASAEFYIDNVSVREVIGYEGIGWSFDGVDDHIDLGTGDWANITSDVTIVGWVRPSTYVGSHVVVRKGYSQSPFNLCLVGTDLRFYYTVGSSWGGVDGPLSTPEGRWLCIAATRSFSGALATLKLFENGNLISSGTRNGVPDSTAQGASIGYDNSGGDYLYGSVGEVLIFGRALAPQEIRDYYEVTRHRYGV